MHLLNEVHQSIYTLYQGKEMTKKVYDNIMNSIYIYIYIYIYI